MRGGLTLVAGVLVGNALGFARVAIIAYLLGTHSRADSLAVAVGPMDTLNSVLINSIVFAFVPMLTACAAGERGALFQKINRCLTWALAAIAAACAISAPWLMRALAPGLDPAYFDAAVTNMRVLSVSIVATGLGAVRCAMLYTERRFAPTAFYQATLNVFTIAGALALWKEFGVSAFAIGYSVGAWAQYCVVRYFTRAKADASVACSASWRDILMKPAFFMVYASALGLNIVFTRAWATNSGPGMAAALDYCMRGVAVPMALLVNPLSNSMLPEIARLRSLSRWKEAFKLVDRTLAVTALAAVGGCAFALLFRKPAIALMFERGSFTAESTVLVSAAFLSMGPSLIGWSLMEVTGRSLFSLEKPWAPVIAAFIPVLVNVTVTMSMGAPRPETIGVGSAVGLLAGFLALFAMAHAGRARWAPYQ